MSLRWHLSGLHLSELWRKLGSGDEKLLASLHAQFRERAERAIARGWFEKRWEAEQYESLVRQILDRAVRQGAPFTDLESENGVHVDAADALARDGQTIYETDSWDWKHGAW